MYVMNTNCAFSWYNSIIIFNRHSMHGKAVSKLFTDVEIKVDINVAEDFTSHCMFMSDYPD